MISIQRLRRLNVDQHESVTCRKNKQTNCDLIWFLKPPSSLEFLRYPWLPPRNKWPRSSMQLHKTNNIISDSDWISRIAKPEGRTNDQCTIYKKKLQIFLTSKKKINCAKINQFYRERLSCLETKQHNKQLLLYESNFANITSIGTENRPNCRAQVIATGEDNNCICCCFFVFVFKLPKFNLKTYYYLSPIPQIHRTKIILFFVFFLKKNIYISIEWSESVVVVDVVVTVRWRLRHAIRSRKSRVASHRLETRANTFRTKSIQFDQINKVTNNRTENESVHCVFENLTKCKHKSNTCACCCYDVQVGRVNVKDMQQIISMQRNHQTTNHLLLRYKRFQFKRTN